jgi:hypothetical protein
MSIPFVRSFLVLCCGIGLFAGCGDGGPALGKVTGKITLDGKAAPGILVTFVPESGGSPSYGVTELDGQYKLMFTDDKDGAIVGKHKVTLEVQKRPSKDEIEDFKAQGLNVPEYTPVKLPKKYRSDGALSAEVAKGKNDISFELTSD